MSASPAEAAPRTPTRRITSLEVLCAVLVLAVLARGPLIRVVDVPAVRTGATVFVAVCVQAMPFLVLGVLVSGLIAAFVSPSALRRVLPRSTVAAVPVAGLAGMALPGCECASVPVSRRLMQQGVPPAAALAFLLAAPAVNPVVLVATAVAFPGAPPDGAGPVPRLDGHRAGDGMAVGACRASRVDRAAGTVPHGAGTGP